METKTKKEKEKMINIIKEYAWEVKEAQDFINSLNK